MTAIFGPSPADPSFSVFQTFCGHVLRRKDGHVLRRALEVEVKGQRKKERLKRTWKKQVEKKVGLRREDALCRSKWSVGVNKIPAGLR